MKNHRILWTFWNQLKSVSCFDLCVANFPFEKINYSGSGKVSVTEENRRLIFHEKGAWKQGVGQEVRFTNTYRWIYFADAGKISLEHLRQGLNSAVFLIDLIPLDANTLSSIGSHFCKNDCYFCQMQLDGSSLKLNWTITGPKKNEKIQCIYYK